MFACMQEKAGGKSGLFVHIVKNRSETRINTVYDLLYTLIFLARYRS